MRWPWRRKPDEDVDIHFVHPEKLAELVARGIRRADPEAQQAQTLQQAMMQLGPPQQVPPMMTLGVPIFPPACDAKDCAQAYVFCGGLTHATKEGVFVIRACAEHLDELVDRMKRSMTDPDEQARMGEWTSD